MVSKMNNSKLPSEWKSVKFKDVCSIVNGQVDPRHEPYCSMPHIGPGNMEKMTGRLLEYGTAKEDNQTSGKYLFDDTHVLYGKINPQFGKVVFPRFKGICSADVYPIKTDFNSLLPMFLKYTLLNNHFYKYAVSNSGRTGMPKINRNELEAYDLNLPSITEQHKIATILTSVDDAIEKTEAVIKQTGKVKTALMQQLLTKGISHTEFKQTEIGEIPVSWDLKELKIITTRITDGTHQSPAFTNEGIPFLLVSNIKSGVIDWDTDKYISEEAYKLLTKNVVPEMGDILYSAVGSYGVAVTVETENRFSFQRHIAHIKPMHNKVNSNFLKYVLNSPIGRKQADKVAVGNAQKTVTLGSLSDFAIPLPSLSEQIEIVKILSTADKSIEYSKKYFNELVHLKRGLAQLLLTGKVRVNVDESTEVLI